MTLRSTDYKIKDELNRYFATPQSLFDEGIPESKTIKGMLPKRSRYSPMSEYKPSLKP